jgi:DNA-binding response OmpR family regulator
MSKDPENSHPMVDAGATGDPTPALANALPEAGGEEALPEEQPTAPDLGFDGAAEATVMLVDDEPIIVDTLKVFLEDVGYQKFVTTTESTKALDLIANEMPDVVLLDVNMPKVTGLDILNGMRSNEVLKHIPAIILTGATDSATKLVALGLGATDVLGKPVDASELLLRVRNTLKFRRADRPAEPSPVHGALGRSAETFQGGLLPMRLADDRYRSAQADQRQPRHHCRGWPAEVIGSRAG